MIVTRPELLVDRFVQTLGGIRSSAYVAGRLVEGHPLTSVLLASPILRSSLRAYIRAVTVSPRGTERPS